MEKEIGFNLLLDIYGVDKSLLTESKLLKLLKKIIKNANLTPFGKPLIKKLKVKNIKPSLYGYSIIQVIKESHIAFNSWPEYNYLAVDIFSCKPFPEKEVVEILKEELKCKKIKIKKFMRKIKII